MAASHLFRLGRIKGKNGIEEALKHNRREIQQERGADGHIDDGRIALNYSLHGEGNAREIALRAKVAMLEAGIEAPRKNGVMGVEILFSLPIDRHQQDTRPFFEDCLSWAQRNMQGLLLAFDVHLDEAAPHAHAVILPLVEGRMQGSDMIGNTGNMRRLRSLFHSEVARHYGLSLGLAVATTTLYKIPKEVFGMYESASIHTKVKHKTPLAFKVFVMLLIIVPMLGYNAWQRVQARTSPEKVEEQAEPQTMAISQTVQAMTPEQVEAEKAKLQEQEQGAQPETVVITKSLRLVESSVLWPAVAACVDFRGQCRCYGDEGDRLDVPESACRSGIENRWSGRGMPAETTTRRHDEAET